MYHLLSDERRISTLTLFISPPYNLLYVCISGLFFLFAYPDPSSPRRGEEVAGVLLLFRYKGPYLPEQRRGECTGEFARTGREKFISMVMVRSPLCLRRHQNTALFYTCLSQDDSETSRFSCFGRRGGSLR